jgi:hypothetical protein
MNNIVYCDADSGTWFLVPPVRIDSTNWDDADWNSWDNVMSDADRGAYAEQWTNAEIEGTTDHMPSPREYCRGEVGDG